MALNRYGNGIASVGYNEEGSKQVYKFITEEHQ